jgi:hypothetical protein
MRGRPTKDPYTRPAIIYFEAFAILCSRWPVS